MLRLTVVCPSEMKTIQTEVPLHLRVETLLEVSKDQLKLKGNDWILMANDRNLEKTDTLETCLLTDRFVFLLKRGKEVGGASEDVERNLCLAMISLPEAFVHQPMLYIKLYINRYPIVAFVDTGAQVSLMTHSTAVTCGLAHLIDSRFRLAQRGVGGASESLGRILYCPVTIGATDMAASFLVVEDNVTEEVILGLDFLKKHGAEINLKKDSLTFANGTVVSFLSEEEAEKRRQFG